MSCPLGLWFLNPAACELGLILFILTFLQPAACELGLVSGHPVTCPTPSLGVWAAACELPSGPLSPLSAACELGPVCFILQLPVSCPLDLWVLCQLPVSCDPYVYPDPSSTA